METLVLVIVTVVWILIITAPTYMVYKLYERLESYKFTKSRIENDIKMVERDLNSGNPVSPKEIRYITDNLHELHLLSFTKLHTKELMEFHEKVDELILKIK